MSAALPACGFVCRDFAENPGIEAAMADPRKKLASVSFVRLRAFVHTLLRAERWADGYSSFIRDGLSNGALEIVASRLESDESLRAPEIIEPVRD